MEMKSGFEYNSTPGQVQEICAAITPGTVRVATAIPRTVCMTVTSKRLFFHSNIPGYSNRNSKHQLGSSGSSCHTGNQETTDYYKKMTVIDLSKKFCSNCSLQQGKDSKH